MLFFRIVYILFLGAGLFACSFHYQKKVFSNNQNVLISNPNTKIDSIINPYKKELAEEMNLIIAQASCDFINAKPSGNLGNLVSTTFLNYANRELKNPAVCILNFGGLRANINKGNVSVGDIFKVLPFDNFLVYVKLEKKYFNEAIEWILKTQHPFAGFTIDKNQVDFNDEFHNKNDFIWIVTNDYLANGGDGALFFQKALEIKNSGRFLRDIFIEEIKSKTLEDINEQRLKL